MKHISLVMIALALASPAVAADGLEPPAATDCIPYATFGEPGPTGFPAIHIQCDSSGQPCGIIESPVCWAMRFGCYMAFQAVVNTYDYNLRELRGEWEMVYEDSSCEGQPPSDGVSP